MDQRQQKQVNEAAEKFADAIKESYQEALADRSVSAQKLNAPLTQEIRNSSRGSSTTSGPRPRATGRWRTT